MSKNGKVDDRGYWVNMRLMLVERQRELEALVKDIEASDDPTPRHPKSFAYWREYEAHGVLPFKGAWLEQPDWFHQDVAYFRIVEELTEIPYRIAECDEELAKPVRT